MKTIIINELAPQAVDIPLIFKIIDITGMDSDNLTLLFSNNENALKNNLGVCMPFSFSKFNEISGIFLPHISKINNFTSSGIGIAISKKISNLRLKYPAYYCYIIAHELGHVNICLSDISQHTHYCLIQEFINRASKGKKGKWHEFPHEILFDQYGIFVVEKIYGRRKLNSEILEIMATGEIDDLERHEVMLKLTSTSDLSNLREELVKFSLPYKNELIELWTQERKMSSPNTSITHLIDNYNELFE